MGKINSKRKAKEEDIAKKIENILM